MEANSAEYSTRHGSDGNGPITCPAKMIFTVRLPGIGDGCTLSMAMVAVETSLANSASCGVGASQCEILAKG